jgi:Calcium-activated chloride channel
LDVFVLHDNGQRRELLQSWVAPGFHPKQVFPTESDSHESGAPGAQTPSRVMSSTVGWASGMFRTLCSLNQPLRLVNEYLGSDIALYFAWLQHYAQMLIFPAILGVILVISRPLRGVHGPKGDVEALSDTTDELTPLFCLVLGFWTLGLCESWKRRQAVRLVWACGGVLCLGSSNIFEC